MQEPPLRRRAVGIPKRPEMLGYPCPNPPSPDGSGKRAVVLGVIPVPRVEQADGAGAEVTFTLRDKFRMQHTADRFER